MSECYSGVKSAMHHLKLDKNIEVYLLDANLDAKNIMKDACVLRWQRGTGDPFDIDFGKGKNVVPSDSALITIPIWVLLALPKIAQHKKFIDPKHIVTSLPGITNLVFTGISPDGALAIKLIMQHLKSTSPNETQLSEMHISSPTVVIMEQIIGDLEIGHMFPKLGRVESLHV